LSFKPFDPPDNFSLEELQERLQILKEQGYLPIFGKKRSAAVGESLERYLGLNKNISKKADWGQYEIKTTSRKKLTLFSISWNFQNGYDVRKLVLNFGKKHFSKHLQEPVIRLDWGIKHSLEPLNELYYEIVPEREQIHLKWKKEIIGTISKSELKRRFLGKIKNLVIIDIKKETRDNITAFKVEKATLLENASFSRFLDELRLNNIKIEFVLMMRDLNRSSPRLSNRGVFVRGSLKSIMNLFDQIIPLL
jgi:hypothetical protein